MLFRKFMMNRKAIEKSQKMINTQLHNTLIEKEMEHKILQYDLLMQKRKTAVFREKLKSTLLIIAVIFLILLLLIFLYWIFPSKNGENSYDTPSGTKKSTSSPQNIKKVIAPEQSSGAKGLPTFIPKRENPTNTNKSNKQGSTQEYELKNGIEYIKQNNYVYKKEWKDGYLTHETKLEKTIEDSRKKFKEKIPQLAAPKQGKNKQETGN